MHSFCVAKKLHHFYQKFRIVKLKFISLLALVGAGYYAYAQNNIAEEVAWVVGDEPIYKSQIEENYAQAQ